MTTQDKIVEISDGMKELLLEKNKRYGDSALNPKKIFSKEDAVSSILIRLDDKLNRIQNSDSLRLNDVCDLIGYLELYLISCNFTKEDILELID